jgi:hypothetical protein
MKTSNNERGQAIIGVLVLSFIFVSLYMGFQSYWDSRLHTLSNIREAYNLMDATDQAASDVRAAWDLAASNVGVGATPAAIQAAMAGPPGTMPAMNPVCAAGCAGAALCYVNPLNANTPYCFYSGTGSTISSLDLRLVIPEDKKTSIAKNLSIKIGDSIVSLFDKVRGNGVFENRALAYTNTIFPRGSSTSGGDSVGVVPACPAAGSPPCMVCSSAAAAGLNNNTGVCSTIFSCPKSFKSCSAFAATPGGQGALFYQQFYLSPSGNAN